MTAPDTIDLGTRRDLMVDDFLIDHQDGTELRLHHPTPQELILTSDRPWEGNMNSFNTIIHVDGGYRLYYRGWHIDVEANAARGGWKLEPSHTPTICLATSSDGIHWERPSLGHIEFDGSTDNNIVFDGLGWHGFSPWLDSNPDCKPDERYKAIGVQDAEKPYGLLTFASADGIRWRPLLDAPVLVGKGDFDSHNVAYWDPAISRYRCYFRINRVYDDRRVRDIMLSTSPDLREWSEPVYLDYADAPEVQLYTNNIMPYPRAPHLQVALPARYVKRDWTPSTEQLPELEHRRLRSKSQVRYGTATSDAVLMTSRDGLNFRRWGEAFIRPGLRTTGSWTYGDTYPVWGMIETPSALDPSIPELSVYAGEGYWRGKGSHVRRYTLRLDGFVSCHAPYAGGRFLTKPLTFDGSRLSLNISTSAAGGARVAILDADGGAIPGFALDDCYEIIGDTLDYTVTWTGGADLSALRGRPVRLQVELRDSDLYALQFC